jgi:predicted DNA-binding transcriptional regulator AlpA
MNETPDLLTTANRLALRPKEAAQALGISERLLWTKTNCNEIPHCRIGRAIVYPVDLLREWLTQQVKGGDSR